jgi:hypothetical protein
VLASSCRAGRGASPRCPSPTWPTATTAAITIGAISWASSVPPLATSVVMLAPRWLGIAAVDPTHNSLIADWRRVAPGPLLHRAATCSAMLDRCWHHRLQPAGVPRSSSSPSPPVFVVLASS